MCHSKSVPLSIRLAKNPLAFPCPIPSSETLERRAFLAMLPSLGTRGIRSSACLPALPACLPSALRASRCGAFGESGGGVCSFDSPARGSFAAWGAGKPLANQVEASVVPHRASAGGGGFYSWACFSLAPIPPSFLQARMGWKRWKRRPPENALFVSIARFLAVSSFTEKTTLRFLLVSSFVSLRFPFPAYRGKLETNALNQHIFPPLLLEPSLFHGPFRHL
jgi:hypothetical protein